jgi:DNA polymerase-3 subunit delta
MADPKPAYLLQGDDEVKIDGWRKRVHDRAAEDPDASLELFADQTPAEEVAAAMAAMTLATGRRWMLVEGVERWKEKDVAAVVPALDGLPPATTVVFVAAGKVDKKGPPAPAKLIKAVEQCGGDVKAFEAPKSSGYGRWTMDQASQLGLTLSPDAAQMLVHRIGEDEKRHLRERRVMRELEKIAIYAPDGGRVEVETVEELTASDGEARTYQLADALAEGDHARATALAEDLRDRGADIMYVLFALLRKVRETRQAWAVLEAGGSIREVQAAVGGPPWRARIVAQQAERADGAWLERLEGALADLDYAVRGGTNVDAATELTLLVSGAGRT